MSFDIPFELPRGWEVKTVEQLIKDGIIQKPLDGNHGEIHPKSSDYVSEGVPFIMASDLNAGRIDLSGCKFIIEKQANNLRKGFAKSGDVLISHKATIGRTAIVQKNDYPYIILTPQVTYYRVIDDQKLSNVYLKAYFDSPFFQSLMALWAGSGSTRAYLGITGQLKLPVIVPPIDSQKFIANHVVTLNEKLELNTQTNQTLEQIAQALFKSWFVDFDPVKAKISVLEAGGTEIDAELAAMSIIAAKSAKQLAELKQSKPDAYEQLAQTAALFPSAMQESELGEIPCGWKILPLDKVAHYQNGLALQKFRPLDENDYLPVVKIAQLKKGFADGEEKASPNIKPKCIIDNGDVIFSWSGSLIVDIWCSGKAALNQHLFKVTSEKLPKWFYYYFTKHHLAEFQRIAADKAVTMGHIKREHLSSAKCTIAPNEVILKGTELIGTLLEKQIEKRLENNILAETRDTLLPQLLSSKITPTRKDTFL